MVLQKTKIEPFVDSMLPEFPQIKDFQYDLVGKFNEYRMFISDESIFNFPPAKYFEGPASGSVLICADHDCNREFGFKDSENCIMYEVGNIDDLLDRVSYYMKNETILSEIQEKGTNFVRSTYSHKQVALNLFKTIEGLKK